MTDRTLQNFVNGKFVDATRVSIHLTPDARAVVADVWIDSTRPVISDAVVELSVELPVVPEVVAKPPRKNARFG